MGSGIRRLEIDMSGLNRTEAYWVVHDYIGVSSGYLGDFSYRTHEEFYPRYCDLDIDPNAFDGTTKERFLLILENADPTTQAKILRGVLKKFSISHFPLKVQHEKSKVREEIEQMIERIEIQDPDEPKIPNPTLSISSDVVERALKDAESLIESNGPISGIDRIHTALHGYLIEACRRADLLAAKDASLPSLFNVLVRDHPAFKEAVHREGDILKILRSFGAVLDSLGPVRNMASMAHPNKDLLGNAEALLVVHAGWTILHYVDSKLAEWYSSVN
jgi:hypothetical protein